MDATQLRENIVRRGLQALQLHSEAAENLVMGTAAQESHLQYIHQLGGGPALSLFQMEPATHDDIWEHYLRYQEDLAARLLDAIDASGPPNAGRLEWDLLYSAMMCRIHYRRVPAALPSANDVEGLAAYWKDYYNTHLGAGTTAEFVHNYELVKGD